MLLLSQNLLANLVVQDVNYFKMNHDDYVICYSHIFYDVPYTSSIYIDAAISNNVSNTSEPCLHNSFSLFQRNENVTLLNLSGQIKSEMENHNISVDLFFSEQIQQNLIIQLVVLDIQILLQTQETNYQLVNFHEKLDEEITIKLVQFTQNFVFINEKALNGSLISIYLPDKILIFLNQVVFEGIIQSDSLILSHLFQFSSQNSSLVNQLNQQINYINKIKIITNYVQNSIYSQYFVLQMQNDTEFPKIIREFNIGTPIMKKISNQQQLQGHCFYSTENEQLILEFNTDLQNEKVADKIVCYSCFDGYEGKLCQTQANTSQQDSQQDIEKDVPQTNKVVKKVIKKMKQVKRR